MSVASTLTKTIQKLHRKPTLNKHKSIITNKTGKKTLYVKINDLGEGEASEMPNNESSLPTATSLSKKRSLMKRRSQLSVCSGLNNLSINKTAFQRIMEESDQEIDIC